MYLFGCLDNKIKFLINFKVALIKLLSCMDAVFKLLHVEVATNGNEKKNEVEKIRV